MKHKLLASFKNTWRSGLSLHLPIAPFANQSQDKNHYSARRSSPLFLVLVFLVLLGKPVLGLASMCMDLTPNELIQNSNLIFKGKVIGVKILFKDKIIVNDEIEKIWFQRDLNIDDRQKVLFKAIKTHKNSQFYRQLFDPARLHYLTKYTILAPYKGPAFDNIEVENVGGLHYLGEEETVFADKGYLKNGYFSHQCGGFSYWWASEHGDQSYQTALDAYRQKQEQLTTALQLSPHNPALLKEQGAFYLQYHDFNSAEWAYQELRLHHPKDVAGLVGLADVRFNRAQHEHNNDKKVLYEQGLAGYESILKIDRNNRAARHGKTLILLILGRWSELDKSVRDFSGRQSKGKNVGNYFVGRHLVKAKFRNAILEGINFSNADLRHADFSGATIWNCNFTNAKLSHSIFRNLKGAEKAKFNGADFQYADFTEANLEEVDFGYADLQHADFTKADLQETSFAKATINKAKFNNAQTCGLFKTTWPIGFDPQSAGVKNCK
ncbi:MAG: pentapeptide repeat-containing protein [Methylovulum miyakonense]|uniref:pentapeptide repeat-containing protein n=1 Tax=Methylovulum miyakonense TaxID=645578 RepID=UPI003BB5FB41